MRSYVVFPELIIQKSISYLLDTSFYAHNKDYCSKQLGIIFSEGVRDGMSPLTFS